MKTMGNSDTPPRARHWTLRVFRLVSGSMVVLLGIIIIPLPGPWGAPVMLLGLGILSTESSRARWLMDKLRARFSSRKANVDPPIAKSEKP